MKTIIISLGGSLVVPDDINTDFIKRFTELILKYKDRNRFIIVVGGGKTCRNYASAAFSLNVSEENRDWIGIMTSRLNAELVRSVFSDSAYEKVIYDPTQKIDTDKLIIAAGYKPGWSTDYVATLFAETYGIKEIINLSNIDYVYDKNPKEFEDAKPIEKMSWKRMKDIVGDSWKPSLNAPFDPVAVKKAENLGLRVVILNGKDIENLTLFLDGEKFKGSDINAIFK